MDAAPALDYGLLDRTGVARQIFYPRADRTPAPTGAVDIPVEVEPGVHVGTRLYAQDPAFPSVLYFHGNGEVASDYDDIAPLFHQVGANLWVADFRGYGASEGRPTFASLVGDAHPVLDFFHAELDRRGFNPSRFVMGRSLGSHPAIELGARRPERLRGLILESGASSLNRLAQRFANSAAEPGLEELVRGHQEKIASIRLPVLIIHGAEDELVPVETALDLNDTLSEAETELVIIPDAGHNDLLWVGLQRYFSALGAFVQKYAGEAERADRA
jgi:pimeloyl-ACP methyl ester carboxylesterase